MKQIVKKIKEPFAVIEYDKNKIACSKIYIAVDNVGNIYKLSYDHGEGHWNLLNRVDNGLGKTKNCPSTYEAMKNALDVGYEVFEFDSLLEFSKWLTKQF
jgi:hypothetical protein